MGGTTGDKNGTKWVTVDVVRDSWTVQTWSGGRLDPSRHPVRRRRDRRCSRRSPLLPRPFRTHQRPGRPFTVTGSVRVSLRRLPRRRETRFHPPHVTPRPSAPSPHTKSLLSVNFPDFALRPRTRVPPGPSFPVYERVHRGSLGAGWQNNLRCRPVDEIGSGTETGLLGVPWTKSQGWDPGLVPRT